MNLLSDSKLIFLLIINFGLKSKRFKMIFGSIAVFPLLIFPFIVIFWLFLLFNDNFKLLFLNSLFNFESSKNAKFELKSAVKLSFSYLELIVPFSSFVYLIGTKIDFSDDLLNGGFKFSNPQANRTCGCGTSFSV